VISEVTNGVIESSLPPGLIEWPVKPAGSGLGASLMSLVGKKPEPILPETKEEVVIVEPII
jgi:hypothetical protein